MLLIAAVSAVPLRHRIVVRERNRLAHIWAIAENLEAQRGELGGRLESETWLDGDGVARVKADLLQEELDRYADLRRDLRTRWQAVDGSLVRLRRAIDTALRLRIETRLLGSLASTAATSEAITLVAETPRGSHLYSSASDIRLKAADEALQRDAELRPLGTRLFVLGDYACRLELIDGKGQSTKPISACPDTRVSRVGDGVVYRSVSDIVWQSSDLRQPPRFLSTRAELKSVIPGPADDAVWLVTWQPEGVSGQLVEEVTLTGAVRTSERPVPRGWVVVGVTTRGLVLSSVSSDSVALWDTQMRGRLTLIGSGTVLDVVGNKVLTSTATGLGVLDTSVDAYWTLNFPAELAYATVSPDGRWAAAIVTSDAGNALTFVDLGTGATPTRVAWERACGPPVWAKSSHAVFALMCRERQQAVIGTMRPGDNRMSFVHVRGLTGTMTLVPID
jgi:hypothetical protein